MRITKLLLRLAGSEIESTFVFILPLTPHISVAFMDKIIRTSRAGAGIKENRWLVY